MALFGSGKAKYSTIKISRSSAKKRDIPEGLWLKCRNCSRTLYKKELEKNLSVCPHCNYHAPLSVADRVKLLTDAGSFQELDKELKSADPLKFVDSKKYTDRLSTYEKVTGSNEAVTCGVGTIDGKKFAIGVMNFSFFAGSMGSVVGEKITRMLEKALELKIPAVMVTASGGARMQEGILSLMQMPKTCAALDRLAEAGLPYIVILANPTYGGVTASYATLGDINIAEPGAMVGFAGPRVIQETINASLPEGFQTAEFLLEKGLIDRVVDRKNLRKELALCLEYFGK
ncbi:acetyl-CoA carboxylase, carboxyltransferase subunit beta [Lentisphaerota bacterium ZTH]|nr:acetyl-CoA carboxylase carboxyltransferase subunit beta [Lentisphaerota bacterium]WET07201.1 acetyl-CoA carboxylase, carboxyltransferase subunit beta [Lentisphaerota bacterium ZTH]